MADGGPDLGEWVGRERTRREVLPPFPARGMAALLDRPPEAFEPGSPLPPCWHWLYFRDAVPRSRLGPDGHERRGEFLPPVPLPRRMWAGGRLRFSRPLRVGQQAERRSMILSVEEKSGTTGRLVFVTVGHELVGPRGTAVEEEQVLVYRGERAGDGVRRPGRPLGHEPAWSESLALGPVLLFRYSALTFNAHRIHYDHPYATGEEGYPERLVHAPLTATLLADAARRRSAAPLSLFEYRATSPLFCGEETTLAGWPADDGPGDDDPGTERAEGGEPPGREQGGREPEAEESGERPAGGHELRAVDPEGRVAMRARASTASAEEGENRRDGEDEET